MRVPAFLGAAFVVLATAAPSFAQESAGTAAETPAGPPSVTVINPAASPAAPAPAAEAAAAPAAPSTSSEPAPAASDAPTVTVTEPPAPAGQGATTPAPAAEAAAPPPPEPTLFVNVDLSSQRMTVKQMGGDTYVWPISSAAYGYTTPTGTFRPTWMSKMHYSRQYDLAPMPNAIFFHRGAAIHGTQAVRQLGRPASHGCVRLAPRNAATLFNLVNRHGKAQTKIVVHGKPRYGSREIAEARRMRYEDGRGGYFDEMDYDYRWGRPFYYGDRMPPRGLFAKPRRAPREYYNRFGYGYGF